MFNDGFGISGVELPSGENVSFFVAVRCLDGEKRGKESKSGDDELWLERASRADSEVVRGNSLGQLADNGEQ
ncbi:hypothetical protein BHYA_0059g00190 [Botrytis hyacinthi]|uniref:Uncharacterized protein n=1 Tax=Botrytis hyacinthi TaxID=278943 RepID=A0A4Z1GQZ3_9HELO|nr:hypothetical protein BHYA_0059g00190 [Botrytis hyacinthi]